MKLTINQFFGEIPRLSDRLIPDGYGTLARNARLERGILSPFRQATAKHTFASDVSSIYLHDSTWRGWPGEVNAVPGPVAEDRLYVTGDGPPKMLFDGNTYTMGIPSPTNPPDVALLGTLDETIAEEVLYVFTWVSDLGEEGAPSPASDRVLWSSGLAVRVSNFDPTPVDRRITKRRLYRSQTSAAGITGLFFVAEFDVQATFYDHDAELEPPAEEIPSRDYDEPPDGMSGIIEMANGIMAAFNGKEVLFSEAFLPHAWPAKYVLTVNDPIVGLASFHSTLAILTTGTPYIAQGYEPQSMAMERIEERYPCLSARGIVDLGYTVAYPSTDGLVTLSTTGGARLVTRTLFTREQWQALNPETFRAARLADRYVFSHIPDGATERELGFIELTGDQPFYFRMARASESLFFDLTTGYLYELASDLRTVHLIDDLSAPHENMTWQSGEYHLPAEIGFGVIFVEGKPLPGGSVTVKIIADGSEIAERTGLNQIHRLPTGQHQVWQIRVDGAAEINRITLAGFPSEIANG